ncbi:MAG TPA: SPOR domain-containing protein [Bacteroidales bacterium]|nr:SPOR domain-containing protein [Bacteroidales bacterium]
MRSLLLLTIIFFSFSLIAQEQRGFDTEKGDVVVYQDARIDSLVKQHITLNKAFPGIDGYRVMIFFDAGNNSKDTAYRVMIEFNEEYPDIPAYISFNPPYYRVRVGDFRTELEAVRFRNKIKWDYPNAWVVSTTIQLPKLSGRASGD